VPIEFNASVPIYLQIIDLIRQAVVSGSWPAGGKVPSVRDLAIEYGVNPNTVQRALSELERDGLLYAERTAGRFVTTDQALIGRLRLEQAERQIDRFREQMAALGYTEENVLQMMRRKWSDNDGHD
jgi:GntR family transcriptional regulator